MEWKDIPNYEGYQVSDTFRPTQEKRIHKDYPYSKTLCTRDDSCCVMLSGGELYERFKNKKTNT